MPNPSLDTIDRRIVATLQEDGRRTNVDVADAVGLSPSPCLRRIKRLEAEGVIRGYRAMLDRKTVGLGLDGVRRNPRREALEGERAACIRRCSPRCPRWSPATWCPAWRTSSPRSWCRTLRPMSSFLTERLLVLPMVADVRSNFALREIKSAAPLPLDHLP